LKHFCKSYETNRKSEKKKKEQKKEEKGRGVPSGPAPEEAHGPAPRIPKAVRCDPSPLANMWGATCHLQPQAEVPGEHDIPSGRPSRCRFSRNPNPISTPTSPIKALNVLSFYPLSIFSKDRQAARFCSSESAVPIAVSHRFRRNQGKSPPPFYTPALLSSVRFPLISSLTVLRSRTSTSAHDQGHFCPSSSSHPSSSPLEAIVEDDHVTGLPTTRRTPSTSPQAPEGSRMPATLVPWPQPRRSLAKTLAGVSPLFFSP
jgi:hypothetical protein